MREIGYRGVQGKLHPARKKAETGFFSVWGGWVLLGAFRRKEDSVYQKGKKGNGERSVSPELPANIDKNLGAG